MTTKAEKPLKPYMAFSREAGAGEGAILVIAHTAKEARRLAWRSGECLNVYEWTDLAMRLIRDTDVLALADQAKLQQGLPHVVATPVECEACELWGAGIINETECGWCGEYPGDRLVNRYANLYS